MPGLYRLDIPDAAIASGKSVVVTLKGATGMVQVDEEIQLEAVDAQDSVRMGMTALPNAAAEAAGGIYTRGTGAGQINQANNGQIDANAARLGGTTQTGRDIGASVLLSTGTGTGQLDFTSGVVKANLAQILGTALTETSGQIAAAFKKFFDKGTPTGTINSLPDAVPDASGGLPVTGTRLTAIPTLPSALTADGNIKADALRLGGTVQTGRDIGASVLLSTGTGAGQLDFTSGVVKANLAQILGTAITETAGQIAAAFKQFFDVASPTGNMKAITNVVTATTTTTATNLTNNNDKTGYALSSGGVQAIWDALTSALTTAGSIGKSLVDNAHTAASVWAVGTRLLTAGTNIVLAKGTGVTGLNDLDAAGVRTAVGLASANLDTQIDALPTNAELATALGTADDATLAAIAALNNISVANIFAYAYEGSETFKDFLRLLRAANVGIISGAGGTTIHIKDAANTKDRITATVDGDGDRSAVTTDPT